jgi:hypothetical protein
LKPLTDLDAKWADSEQRTIGHIGNVGNVYNSFKRL